MSTNSFFLSTTQKALHFGHLLRENIKSSPRRLNALWAVYTSALPRDRPKTAQTPKRAMWRRGLARLLAAAKREKNGRYLERKKRGEEGAHSRFSLLLPTFQGPTTGMGEDFFKEEEGHCQGQHERRLARDYRRGSSRDR